MDIPWPLVWMLLLCVPLIAWMVVKSRARPGMQVDTTSQPWATAIARTQASVPTLRELFADGGSPIDVKFPLQNSKGETEHVWGELQTLSEETFTADLRTPMRRGRPMSQPPFELPIAALEDWQVELPDGRIRGGFTTQLEISLARQQGHAIPAHIESMARRFVDM